MAPFLGRALALNNTEELHPTLHVMSASREIELTESTRRYIAAIEYDGSGFNGWQRQPEGQGVGVQQVLEEALTKVFDAPIRVICAGRTDTGVHAVAQIVHFEAHDRRQPIQIINGTNANLLPALRVRWVVVDESNTFHARFDASARHYRYIIYNNTVASALHFNRSTWVRAPLEVLPMQHAAQYLLGRHDFSSFRGSGCGANSPVRHVFNVEIGRSEHWIWLDISANAFLLHMVRNIVGTLIDVGSAKHPPHWVNEVLRARDRRQASITAPAQGLYFVRADYRVTLPTTDNAPQYWN